jgi:branched-chain amino acid transport system ATP-binding protein
MNEKFQLSLRSVDAGYGPTSVLRGVDLEVTSGEIVAVLGPNGAGKSTLVKTVLGVIPVRSGELRIDGKRVTSHSPRNANKAGIAVVPEGRRVFASQSIADNLRLGAFGQKRSSEELALDRASVYERFPILGERRNQPAASLSGGEAQMLAVGMALMARPRLIILDEPSLGLAPLVVDRVMEEVAKLGQSGVAVLLVEQNVRKALRVARRAVVLNLGRIELTGAASELLENARVGRAYLGG